MLLAGLGFQGRKHMKKINFGRVLLLIFFYIFHLTVINWI